MYIYAKEFIFMLCKELTHVYCVLFKKLITPRCCAKELIYVYVVQRVDTRVLCKELMLYTIMCCKELIYLMFYKENNIIYIVKS